jgi:hypothetical protein
MGGRATQFSVQRWEGRTPIMAGKIFQPRFKYMCNFGNICYWVTFTFDSCFYFYSYSAIIIKSLPILCNWKITTVCHLNENKYVFLNYSHNVLNRFISKKNIKNKSCNKFHNADDLVLNKLRRYSVYQFAFN